MQELRCDRNLQTTGDIARPVVTGDDQNIIFRPHRPVREHAARLPAHSRFLEELGGR
jgi:hypothetical protein